VLSEAFHLLEGIDSGSDQLLTFLERGAVVVSFTYSTRSDDIHRLLRRYADQPMSFADACLVAMTEALDDPRIVTTDDDFRRYRALDGAPLDVRLPGESH
jgi:predicted nucleic acid-binding protein